MLTLPKCYSALVASGHGSKCNTLKEKILNISLQRESNTGEYKSILFKYYKEKYPDIVKEISNEYKSVIEEVASNVDDIYFGNDLKMKTVQL